MRRSDDMKWLLHARIDDATEGQPTRFADIGTSGAFGPAPVVCLHPPRPRGDGVDLRVVRDARQRPGRGRRLPTPRPARMRPGSARLFRHARGHPPRAWGRRSPDPHPEHFRPGGQVPRLGGVDFDFLFARFPGFTTLPPDTTRVYGDHRDDALLAALGRSATVNERHWRRDACRRALSAPGRSVPNRSCAHSLRQRGSSTEAFPSRGVYGNVAALSAAAPRRSSTARAATLVSADENSAGSRPVFSSSSNRERRFPKLGRHDRPDDDQRCAPRRRRKRRPSTT